MTILPSSGSDHSVRDKREKNWFWANNILLDEFASVLGAYAVFVYVYLCRRADNNSHMARVSGGVISDSLGIGRSTVTDATTKLEMHELVDIEERDDEDGAQGANRYTLLPVSALET